MNESYDVLVVGGGPAGLSAALYLARYDRSVAVFDTGHGRSTWHQVNHNYLGFPGGVATRTLRDIAHKQLADYPQVTILAHKIEELQRREQFVACSQAREWHGRAVILCMGVLDHYPHFERWEEYVGRTMFWCIACDGYECKGKRVVAIGNTNDAAVEALQLTRFASQVIMLTNSHENQISDGYVQRLRAARIPLIHDRIATVHGSDGVFEAIVTQGGQTLPLDRLFCEHGATPQSKLARDLEVPLSEQGYILADEEQKTRVPGVYAAGDVTRLHSHQVTTAVHEGGQAASAANYGLYPPELRAD